MPRMNRKPPVDVAPRLKKAVGYVRVSTRRQAQHELSLMEQRRKIEDYCAKNNLKLVDIFVDPGLSGRTLTRPQFKAMMSFVKDRSNGIDALVVYNSSRLCRNTREMLQTEDELGKAGAEFLSVEQIWPKGPDGKMLRTISYAFDEAMSDRNKAVVIDMMLANAEAGYWNGSTPPFGYALEVAVQVGRKQRKRLIVNPNESPVVQLIFDLYLTGGPDGVPLGIKKIASKLNASGERFRGRSFSTSNVEAALKRTAYAGYSCYGVVDSVTRQIRPESEWVRFETPKVIADDVFAEVQRRLAARNPKASAPLIEAGPTMLAGISTCGLCKGGMMLRTGKGGAYRYLTCANKALKGQSLCQGQSIRMDHLDEQVISILLDQALAPKRLSLLCEGVASEAADRNERLANDVDRIRRSIAEVSRKFGNLLSLAADDRSLHDDVTFRQQYNALRQQKEEQAAQLRLAESRKAARETNMTPERLAAFDRRLRELMRNADPHVRKQWVRHFVAEVMVYPDHIRIIGPNDQIIRDLNTERDELLLKVPSFAREWRARKDSNL
jgi:site-specific DNA recombinase